MENVLSFLADNYLYFMIGAVVLLFALIGFAVDGKKKNKVAKTEVSPIANGQMQFGQNPNVQQNSVPNTMQSQPSELNNGVSTGFNQFTNQAPEQVSEQPAEVAPEQVAPTNNTNTEETLSFGPISADNNGSIFTEPPVVENTNGESLTFEMTSTEPTMESLDLGVPTSNTTPSNESMPVSMEPEVPTQNEVPTPTPVVKEEQPVPEMPSLNNTLQ